jgi:hypothetical protein
MSSDRIIVDAIKVAQDLLSQNLPAAQNLSDAAAVMRFRGRRWSALATHFSRLPCERSSGWFPINRRLIGR